MSVIKRRVMPFPTGVPTGGRGNIPTRYSCTHDLPSNSVEREVVEHVSIL